MSSYLWIKWKIKTNRDFAGVRPMNYFKNIIIISTLALLSVSCFVKYTVFNNTEYPDTEIAYPKAAVLEERGYRLWIDGGDGVPSDRLILKPGSYMIRFRHTYSQTGGAAYCEFKAGFVYRLELTERQYLPKSGMYADLAVCPEKPKKSVNPD